MHHGPVRDRLVNEIAALDAVETAIEWAGQNLGAKNTLTAEDASIVEAAFRDRMRVLEPEPIRGSRRRQSCRPLPQRPRHNPDRKVLANSAAADARVARTASHPRKGQGSRIRVEGADNLTSVKPRRYRDKDHLRFIAAQPCTVCGRKPCEAHHLRYAQPRALGRRVSDEFTVPLCRVHHRELHRQGDERAWWNKANIDPMPIALGFWQQTRGVLPAASQQSASLEIQTDVSIEEPRRGGGFLQWEFTLGALRRR